MINLPNYQIIQSIYESTNSLVYRGVRKSDNQPVILKMLKPDYPTPAELTRYQQEYQGYRTMKQVQPTLFQDNLRPIQLLDVYS